MLKTTKPIESHNQEDKINVGVHKLSKREKEILDLYKKGYDTRYISSYLKISVRTVHKHKDNMYRKLNVNSIYQVLKLVYNL